MDSNKLDQDNCIEPFLFLVFSRWFLFVFLVNVVAIIKIMYLLFI